MVLELDELEEARVTREARRRGIDVNELVKEWVNSALSRESVSPVPNSSEELVKEQALHELAFAEAMRAAPPPVDELTLRNRRQAIKELSTFARDRNIHLPSGVTIRDLLEEGRR